ncbi:MAG: acetyl-CoA carboxylase biotin carboxyl carrier protein subunit [Candidatus Wallbacteria bacterium]|nr:acetyl-CoA carboxylase biotin carboxyl carrier protein subunit [Candidatus Wallbacteria bacterium]
MKRLRITVEGKTYEVEVEILEDKGKNAVVKRVVEESSQNLARSFEKSQKIVADALETSIKSPLAGTIIEVKVTEGQSITENQLAVVIEAMKMNTNLYSHKAGRVKKVLCEKGQKVEFGQSLVELE